ncbi:MAG: aspartyl protease family protein [Proteobacteria bacterium]|nr:aspartyl protease family protein [Pseudomonadota bacterium]
MRILRIEWALLLVLSGTQAFGNPPPAGPPDGTVLFASPTRKDQIGRILAPVMINGRGPFRLLVDTGASYSTVSPELAATLGLESSDDYPFVVNGVTGSVRAPSVPIDVLKAGDLELRSLRLPVIWAPIMGGADGILGAAGLRNERIMVEFTRNRVTISRPNIGLAPRGFQRIRAKIMENGLMTVDVRVGGVHAIAIVDTGAERSLGNPALREALRHWQSSRKAPNFTDVFGTSSDIARGERGLAPIIEFGPLKLIDVDLIYGDFHIFDVWDLQKRPAMILGMDVLGTVRSLGIDFRNRELYFEGAYLGVG